MPEIFNTTISHQLFEYIITFVNSQNENKNSKGDFVLKHGLKEGSFSNFLVNKNKSDADLV